MFRHHASKTLHFSSFIITFVRLFLKLCDLQAESCYRLWRQLLPQFDLSLYKGVFTDKISVNIWEILNKIE